MLQLEIQTPSPPSDPSSSSSTRPPQQSLADLSRNTSVISTSSSSSSSSLLLSNIKPRPLRTFSSPRSRSPASPTTPRLSRPPPYLLKDLSVVGHDAPDETEHIAPLEHVARKRRSKSRQTSRSRNSSAGSRISSNDFRFGELLGKGSFSSVHRVTYHRTNKEYAIKMIDKANLIHYKKTEIAGIEKSTLAHLAGGHPGIVRLHWAFQDDWCLYFVLDLVKNGELRDHIARLGSLSLNCARFYTAQLVDIVDFLHSKGVLHRDLKPENLLLDDNMHLKVTDFGSAKILAPGEDRASTFVGTAQYQSPEMLATATASGSSDLWAVGCITYQMITGHFPFRDSTVYLIMQKIKELDYTFPEEFDKDAKDLIEHLLVLDPEVRLGAGSPGMSNDTRALRSHPFFETINWETLWTDPAPPLRPGQGRLNLASDPVPTPADIGALWDALVGGVRDDDEISWASDEGDDETEVIRGRTGQPSADHTPEIGSSNTLTISTIADIARTQKKPSSLMSSSEGSSNELGVTFGALRIEGEQGGMSSALMPDELLVLHSQVEAKTRKRLLSSTSRLIPQRKRQSKSRFRHLILTNRRLVSIKKKEGSGISVKSELAIGPVTPFEGWPRVSSVEAKGEKDFVVYTTGKPFVYSAADASSATRWVREIRSVLEERRRESLDVAPAS